MEACCFLFEAQTEFLNNVQTSFGFEGLIYYSVNGPLPSKMAFYQSLFKTRYSNMTLGTDVRRVFSHP
jgi:hypothetical protein